MRSSISRIFAGLFVVAILVSATWLVPLTIGENDGPIEIARIVSGPNGHLVANWMKSNFDMPFPHAIVARIFTPGAGWSPPETLTAGDTSPQDSGHLAVAADGTVIAVWDEIPADQRLGHFLMARKFVPGRGWGPQQTLGPIWAFPTPAISPDGRGHLVYRDGVQIVARTLSPGEDTWSEPILLRTDSGEYGGEAQVVAGNGFAYATFRSVTVDDRLHLSYEQYLAHYGADGWAPGERISNPNDLFEGEGRLLINNGHVALTWSERDVAFKVTQYVLRLTDTLERFTAPKPFCAMSLAGDGALLMACEVEGEPVPDCFQPPVGRGPQRQFQYRYIETQKCGLNDEQWTAPQIASDVHRRVGGTRHFSDRGTRAFSDLEGNSFLVWNSDVPCGSGSVQVVARVMPSGRCSHDRETLIDEFRPEDQVWGRFGFDATLDGQGTLHVIWAKVRSDGNVPAHFNSTVFTAELSAHRNSPEDVNGDGTVDCADVSIIRASLGKQSGEPGFNPRADINADGIVDVRDLAAVAQKLRPQTQCP